ncbi:DUF6906 family protein [Fredinandcohnia sp. 179-A 10B2 NHS]|uniref:DUF6906 family protein n=1 Tax=Fredinandcohnia sp. 179-A 10B2 NHS TaxID=3235176 RepID=UPI0039A19B32
MWIRLEYAELGSIVGYTGNVVSRKDLVNVFIRLDVRQSDLKTFKINGESQSPLIINRFFEEVDKARERDDELKAGKRPTNKQKQIIKNAGLKPENWLVTRNLQQELHIVHRTSNKQRVITL